MKTVLITFDPNLEKVTIQTKLFYEELHKSQSSNYYRGKIMGNQMSGTCNTNEGAKKLINYSSRNIRREKHHFRDKGLYNRLMLKWTLMQWGMRMWVRLIRVRIRTGSRPLWTLQWAFVFLSKISHDRTRSSSSFARLGRSTGHPCFGDVWLARWVSSLSWVL